MRYLIDQLVLENNNIEKSIPELKTKGDFSAAGKLHFNNLDKIHRLRLLPVKLIIGGCKCKDAIKSKEQNINYCAYCHKEIY